MLIFLNKIINSKTPGDNALDASPPWQIHLIFLNFSMLGVYKSMDLFCKWTVLLGLFIRYRRKLVPNRSDWWWDEKFKKIFSCWNLPLIQVVAHNIWSLFHHIFATTVQRRLTAKQKSEGRSNDFNHRHVLIFCLLWLIMNFQFRPIPDRFTWFY